MLAVRTACKFRGLFPWNTTPQDKSHPSWGKAKPTHPPHTLKKGAGEMNSLQPFCRLGLVPLPFHSGEGALPSWGLGTLSVAAPVAQVQLVSGQQQWPRHRAEHQAPEPGTQTPAGVPRQLLLGGVCLPCCCRHSQGHPPNRTGLPRAASPVPPHPGVKWQQRGCGSIQAASKTGILNV